MSSAFTIVIPLFAGSLLAATPAPGAGIPNPCNSKSGGVFPEVAFHEGKLWCAVQTGDSLRVVELNADLSVASEKKLPLGPGSLAFPRMTAEGAALWIAYRDQATAKLLNLATGESQSLGASGGNDPVAVGSGLVAWQSEDAAFTINTRKLAGGPVGRQGPGRPTGLSRLLPSGRVTLIDDDRFAVPPGTRPCWAADMAVVEGPESGNIAILGHGRQAVLFPGKEAFTPKCAAAGGSYAVASWGREGVFLAVLSRGGFAPAAAAAGAAALGAGGPARTKDTTAASIDPAATAGRASGSSAAGGPEPPLGEGHMRLAAVSSGDGSGGSGSRGPTGGKPSGGAGGGGGSSGGPRAATCEPPNEKALIEEILARQGMAEALKRACRNGTDWTFPDAVVDELRKKSKRWGYLCRRGHCDDPSHDVIAYYCGPGLPGEGASSIRGVDYIVASCYNPGDEVDPKIGWGLLDPPKAGERGWTSRGRF